MSTGHSFRSDHRRRSIPTVTRRTRRVPNHRAATPTHFSPGSIPTTAPDWPRYGAIWSGPRHGRPTRTRTSRHGSACRDCQWSHGRSPRKRTSELNGPDCTGRPARSSSGQRGTRSSGSTTRSQTPIAPGSPHTTRAKPSSTVSTHDAASRTPTTSRSTSGCTRFGGQPTRRAQPEAARAPDPPTRPRRRTPHLPDDTRRGPLPPHTPSAPSTPGHGGPNSGPSVVVGGTGILAGAVRGPAEARPCPSARERPVQTLSDLALSTCRPRESNP